MSIRLIGDTVASPIGDLILVARDDRLCAVEFADYFERTTQSLRVRFGAFELREAPIPRALSACFERYFDGELDSFADLPLSTNGTAFQESVWTALKATRPGDKVTYSGLAEKIGRPRAVRAVGLANGRNPIAIAIPCHRVIGKDGSLTGYAGGLDRKAWLLAHECGIAGQSHETNS